MKIIRSFIILFFAGIFFLTNVFSQKLPDLIPYRKGNKWGFCDSTKKIIIQPVYDKVYLFHEGLAVVCKDKKCGYIDSMGEIAIPLIYFQAWDFKDGLATVENNKGGKGVINKNGKIMVSLKYYGDCNFDFVDGYAIEYNKHFKQGIIDRQGEILFPFRHHNLNRTKDKRYIIVTKTVYHISNSRSLVGLADIANKKMLIPCIYDSIYSPAFLAALKKLNINDSILSFYNKNHDEYKYGDFIIKKDISTKKWGCVNKNGKIIIDFKYDDLNGFIDGYAVASLDKKWGVIDTSGKIVIPFIYAHLYYGEKGVYQANDGYIDIHGTEYWEKE